MADISITDKLGLSADVELAADAPIAWTQLAHLNFANAPLISDFTKRVNECSVKSVEFGTDAKVPQALIGSLTKLTFETGLEGEFELIGAPRKDVFDGDTAPSCPIAADEFWAHIKLNTKLGEKAQVSADGFGFGAEGLGSVGLGTYVLLKAEADGFPTVHEALSRALNQYSVACSTRALRAQRLGTITETEITGSIAFSGTYSVPFTVNPLASAKLPFGAMMTVRPEATVRIGGRVTLSGAFKIRARRTSESELVLGVYKKRGAEFKVTFDASAGLAAGPGNADLLPTVMGAIFPHANLHAAGLTGADAKPIADALKDSIDESLAIAMNACWSAGTNEEAALVYAVALDGSDENKTDTALAAALKGDWTALDGLKNATCERNLFRDTHESKRSLAIHLLGIYNAESLASFQKSCTVLHDENGQVVITDKINASQIRVSSSGTLADAEKLRSALSEAFLATASYVASSSDRGGRPEMNGFSVQQTYIRYRAQMPALEMRREVLLGRALDLLADSSWDQLMTQPGPFAHARITASIQYDRAKAMSLFFRDPAGRTSWNRGEVERIGRQALAALINDPIAGRSDLTRLKALETDEIWNQMNSLGNSLRFGDIPGLAGRTELELGAVAADWVDVTGWATAILNVGPRISDMVTAMELSTASDLSKDANFMHKRQALQGALGSVAQHSRAAFAEGWGLAASFALAGHSLPARMDIGWNGNIEHFESHAAGQQAGTA